MGKVLNPLVRLSSPDELTANIGLLTQLTFFEFLPARMTHRRYPSHRAPLSKCQYKVHNAAI